MLLVFRVRLRPVRLVDCVSSVCLCVSVSGQGLISAAGRNSRVQLLPPEVCHDTQQGLQ